MTAGVRLPLQTELRVCEARYRRRRRMRRKRGRRRRKMETYIPAVCNLCMRPITRIVSYDWTSGCYEWPAF
jgi:hypothetical protein